MSASDHSREYDDFYRRHEPLLRGYLRGRGGSPEIVEDAVKFAFMAILKHWQRLRTQAPKAYLFKVARRRLEEQRDLRRNQELAATERLGEDDIQVTDPDNGIDRTIDRLTIQKLLEQLPHQLRQAVFLRHCCGFSVSDTAKDMGVSEGTVKRYTFDGLQALRKLTDDWEERR